MWDKDSASSCVILQRAFYSRRSCIFRLLSGEIRRFSNKKPLCLRWDSRTVVLRLCSGVSVTRHGQDEISSPFWTRLPTQVTVGNLKGSLFIGQMQPILEDQLTYWQCNWTSLLVQLYTNKGQFTVCIAWSLLPSALMVLGCDHFQLVLCWSFSGNTQNMTERSVSCNSSVVL